ncbi:hypothetical protein POPTR_008G182733v4 [Populus trichocarpa]|jgi:hypothetical protein|uniref:Uncharacterized protein n=1 Tax=Populus trichocarpa TaxID=3694 RepID=A0ACC0SMM0_POPTR|nr:hypothetical protein POPTR_008G182733v4 [Populus trichocarpa]
MGNQQVWIVQGMQGLLLVVMGSVWANPKGEEERERVTRGKLCCSGTIHSAQILTVKKSNFFFNSDLFKKLVFNII